MTNEQIRDYMENSYMKEVVNYLKALKDRKEFVETRQDGRLSIVADMYYDIFKELIWFKVESDTTVDFFTENKYLGKRAY